MLMSARCDEYISIVNSGMVNLNVMGSHLKLRVPRVSESVINLNIKYLAFVVYSIEYRSKRIFQNIAFCFYFCLTRCPNFFFYESGSFTSKSVKTGEREIGSRAKIDFGER